MKRLWLAAPAMALGLVSAAPAQSVVVDNARGQVIVNGQVIRWGDWADDPVPDGWPRKSNIVRGAANGFGNSIVIDNGPGGRGTTVIENSRNGVGNSVVIVDGKVVAPCRVYRGRDNNFWTEKRFDDNRREWQYWSPKDKAWFRYDADAECFRQLPPPAQPLVVPAPPVVVPEPQEPAVPPVQLPPVDED